MARSTRIFLILLTVAGTVMGGILGLAVGVRLGTDADDLDTLSPLLIQLSSLSRLSSLFAVLAFAFAGGVLGFLIGFAPLAFLLLKARGDTPPEDETLI